MEPIEGDSPDPVEKPEGCPYAPRCELATEECRIEKPPLEPVHDPDSEHVAACIHWEQTADAIPLSLGGEAE